MATLAVDGLVSGLDTTGLVTSLIQAESIQQTKLKATLTATKDAAAAYRSVNTKLEALRTAAESLTKATTWGAATATATAGASAAVTGTPQAGSVSFTVDSLAATHAVVSTGRWNGTGDPAGFTELTHTAADGTTRTITVGGSGTVADALRAINDSGLGLTATTIDTNGETAGGLAVQVSATTPGTAQRFSLSGFGPLRQGSDARLTYGDPASPMVVTSTSNTFASLVPGVTFTVSAPGAVTIDVASDPKKVAASVKSLVDAANAALAEVKKHSSATVSGAVLKSDSTLRQLAGDVLSAVSSLVGSTSSPGTVGVQLTRGGTVTFDEKTFLAALADDPARTRTVLGGSPGGPGPDPTEPADDVPAVAGVAQRLLALVDKSTGSSTIALAGLADGRDELARDIQNRIEAWDVRLAARRATLTRQFTAMETALSSLKQQSSWLAGQLAGLPTS